MTSTILRLREALRVLDNTLRAGGLRAALQFEPVEGPAHTANVPLWERMEALGIESGRLGSERPDVS